MTIVSVALCADKNIEVGLHVTLYSLLAKTQSRIRIHFINKGYLPEDLARLHRTLHAFRDLYELIPITLDDTEFAHLRALRGNRFAYLRLLLPDLIDCSRVVYLDCDLLVDLDISRLWAEPLNGFDIGASGIGTIRWSNESLLFRSLGLDIDAPYFNSGVLLLDLDSWRRKKLTQKCLKTGDEHANQLVSADQTILNLVFYRRFQPLDFTYNVALYPATPAIPDDHRNGAIYHFIGAPKPWDFMGWYFHANHSLFKQTLSKTIFAGYKFHHNLSWTKIASNFRNIRSYGRLLRRKLKSTPV